MLQLIEPEPQALWPLAFLAALDGGKAGFDVLTLYFEAGAYHLGTEDQNEDDLEDTGTVLGRIDIFPAFVLGFDPSAARLGLPRYMADVYDPDNELSGILTGEQAIKGVLRVRAIARLGAEDQSANDWPVIWTGVLVDWLSLDGNTVRLVLAQEDAALTKPVLSGYVDARFPYARADAREQAIPRAVGTLDGRASGVLGAVQALYVDTRASEWRFLIIEGWAAEVPRVYADGLLQAEGMDYDILHDTVRGLAGTWAQFLADPGADVDVRCDLTGIESVGDGMGTPWQTPTMQLRELVAEDGLLDEQTLAEVDDFLTAHRRRPRLTTAQNGWAQGRRPARIVTSGAMRKLDLLNEWCECWQAYPYWNEAGIVAFAVIDHRDKLTFHGGVHWVRGEDLFETPRQYPLRPGARNRFLCGPLSSEDQHAALEGFEKLPETWSDQRISESDLAPYVTTQDSGWTFTGGTGFPDTVEAPPWTPDTAYASWAAGTGTFRVRARWSEAPQVPQGDAVQLVEVRWRAKGGGTAKAGVYVGGTAYYGAVETLTGSWVDYVVAFETDPATAAAWFISEIGPDALELIVSATGAADVRAVRARVYTLDGGAAAGLVRERLARSLMLYAQAVPVTELRTVLARGAIRPGDAFSVSSPDAVAPGAAGWGTETWERRRHVLCSRSFKAADKAWLLRALDGQDLQVPMWETGEAEALAPLAPGVLRLGAWQAGLARLPDGRQFSRPTEDDGDPTGQVTITAPWGDSETIEADHEKYGPVALAISPQSGAGPVLEADRLKYLWLHDAQPWPIHAGTAFLRVQYQGNGVILRCGSELVTIEGAILYFRRSVDGTDYETSIDLAGAGIVTGAIVVATRWTPGEGGLTRLDADDNEEDVPPYTLDVWCWQGSLKERGTSVTAVAGFPGDYFDLGSDVGMTQKHQFASWRATPQLLTDDEIAARLEQLLA